ncbi:MAG: prepilin peptidase, partial [Candidatus Omnitrophica bacterium]|nr:prepilin peptidase [Candidatus Omnitrophota bacterium]
GSFANVCIYRLPLHISLLMPRSFCPKCKTGIRWFDNIPLVSFLILGGKCRACKAGISPQYFIVELAFGIIFSGLFLISGFAPELFWAMALLFGLIVITFIDFREMIIPDEISLVGIFVGWLFAFVFPQVLNEHSHKMALGESVLGMIAGGGLIWGTAIIGDFVFKRESMGGGDIKLMAMIGAFLGVQGAVLTFFVAPFFALPFGLFQKYVRKTDILPYGPFLAMAAIFNVFFADWLSSVILGH